MYLCGIWCLLWPTEEDDIIDETLIFYRANVLFRHYEIKGAADKVLIYLTLFTSQCLKTLETQGDDLTKAKSAMHALAVGSFQIPGSPGWPLGGVVETPVSAKDRGWLCIFPM